MKEERLGKSVKAKSIKACTHNTDLELYNYEKNRALVRELYSYAAIQQYSCTAIQLYIYPAIQLYRYRATQYIAIQLYSKTSQLYL